MWITASVLLLFFWGSILMSEEPRPRNYALRVPQSQTDEDVANLSRTSEATIWHLGIVWGHGLKNLGGIIDILLEDPHIQIHMKKVVPITRVNELVDIVYKEDIDRIGTAHIEAKTQYLNDVEPFICVFVFSDSRPEQRVVGLGAWEVKTNMRAVEIKWKIRREYNPRPSTETTRDAHGVYSHKHVIHISDSAEGVDPVLSFLGLPSLAEMKNAYKLDRSVLNKSTSHGLHVSELTDTIRTISLNLRKLDEFGIRYVILRGSLSDVSVEHPDIDILVDEYTAACSVLQQNICGPRDVSNQAVNAGGILYDLRSVGDKYYPDKWAVDMLRRRQRNAFGVFMLSTEDQCYALLYHAIVHKGHIGSGYLEVVQKVCHRCKLTSDILTWLNCLKQWMHNRYEFSFSCHNCGGELLDHVSLVDGCGQCKSPVQLNSTQFNTTVVTALYFTQSLKHSFADYITWLGYIMEVVHEPMVIFVEDSEVVQRLRTLREPFMNQTVFVPMPFENFSMYKMFQGDDFWKKQQDKDSEYNAHRDWKLYLIWNEKVTWLRDTSESNPFNSKYFIWLDAGYIREPQSNLGHIMRRDNVEEDKIYVVNVYPFKPCQTEMNKMGKIFFGKVDDNNYHLLNTSCPARRTAAVNSSIDLKGARGLIAAGSVFGTAQAISKYQKMYFDSIKLYASLSLFVGKEQYMMASLAVENRNFFFLVEPHKCMKYREHFGDPWFAMIPFLQGKFDIHAVSDFQCLTSTSGNPSMAEQES